MLVLILGKRGVMVLCFLNTPNLTELRLLLSAWIWKSGLEHIFWKTWIQWDTYGGTHTLFLFGWALQSFLLYFCCVGVFLALGAEWEIRCKGDGISVCFWESNFEIIFKNGGKKILICPILSHPFLIDWNNSCICALKKPKTQVHTTKRS